MISVKNVSKSYIKKVKTGFLKSKKMDHEAVKNLNLEIKEGQIVGLLGINGAGKSTTIKMLSTLLKPDKGSITIDGMDVLKDAKKIKMLINMIVGGERALYWRLSAKENLRYFGKMYGLSDEKLNEKIEELIDFVGLMESQDDPVEGYSKGMKQKLQIARGLINDPKYLFMDEPTLGLDVSTAKKIRGAVKHLAKEENKGILLTSHYLSEVEELCDYIYVINRGKMILEGPPEKILSLLDIASHNYIFSIKASKKEYAKIIDRLNLLKEVDLVDEKLISEGQYELKLNSQEKVETLLLNIILQEATLDNYSYQKATLEDAMLNISERLENEYENIS